MLDTCNIWHEIIEFQRDRNNWIFLHSVMKKHVRQEIEIRVFFSNCLQIRFLTVYVHTFRFFGLFSRIFPCYHFHLLHLLQTLLNDTLESAKRNAISWQLLSEFSSRSCKFNRFVQVCNFFKSSRCLMNISSAEEAVQNMMLKWKQEWCVKKIWKLRRLEKQRGSLH